MLEDPGLLRRGSGRVAIGKKPLNLVLPRRGWLSGKGAPHVAYGSWVRDPVVRVDTTIGDKGNGLSTGS